MIDALLIFLGVLGSSIVVAGFLCVAKMNADMAKIRGYR